MAAAPAFAYLAAHEVHLAGADGATAPVASKFVEDVRRREASSQRKSSWKARGSGARFMGAAALWDEEGAGHRPPAFFTCLSQGRRRGEILYGLTTGVVSGLFAYDVATGEESRLAHDTDGAALGLATSDDHSVVALIRQQKNGSCNVAVMRDDGGDVALVTDGDTVDGGPSWVPVAPDVKEGRHQLVYHSAGIGRDASGRPVGFAPHAIQLLDAEHGALKTIVSHPEHDYLCPRLARDGALFAMRRPYRVGPPSADAATMLKDGLFAPLRLMYAGFRYLDFFSMKYSGKPLTTAGNAKGRAVDARRLVERQNVASAGDAGGDDEDAAVAPSDWVLVKRTPSGDERVLAKSVAAFDLARDGSLLVTDGRAVDRLSADGARRRLAGARQVLCLVAL